MSGSTGIKIAALLDRILQMQATAATQNDEEKEKARVVSVLLYIRFIILSVLSRKPNMIMLGAKQSKPIPCRHFSTNASRLT